jgi:hypothetical protein
MPLQLTLGPAFPPGVTDCRVMLILAHETQLRATQRAEQANGAARSGRWSNFTQSVPYY